jgi:xanthine dehydrogenase YagT iron-sulfur-binding subunit
MMMIVGTAWLVVYKDAADGMCPTVRDKVNEELLPFFKFLTVNARYDRDLVETPLPMTGLRRPVSYGTCEQGTAERIFMENLSPKDVFFSQIVCETKNIREWTANRSAQPVATSRTVMKRDSPSAARRPAASSSSNFTVTSAAMALGPQLISTSSANAAEKTAPVSAENAVDVHLRVNGKDYALKLDPRTSLLDCLREHLHLTGSKKGCDHGQCGACTVHINGRRQLSCLSFAAMHEGDEITTIEGLGQSEKMHPMQAAFVTCDAYQCGYCTSGQIMSAVALLKEPCGPDDAEVKEFMSGNICRCGAYQNIVAAIQKVRQGAKAE